MRERDRDGGVRGRPRGIGGDGERLRDRLRDRLMMMMEWERDEERGCGQKLKWYHKLDALVKSTKETETICRGRKW